jgi:hypothetical protein
MWDLKDGVLSVAPAGLRRGRDDRMATTQELYLPAEAAAYVDRPADRDRSR